MSKFDEVTEIFSDLKYMRADQANYLREFIEQHECSNLLEIGFFHGKSSAYFAAMLEDLGRGHLTTIDLQTALKREPNILEVLSQLNLTHRVTPTFAERSYTWELNKMIRAQPRPQFDFCYYDGGHTWDNTGFGFFLVDVLLKPGGWVIFDDLNWTIEGYISSNPEKNAKYFTRFTRDEKEAQGVRMVFEYLVPHLNYTNIFEEKKFRWGVAQKSY